MKRFIFALLLVGCTSGILAYWISSLWEGQEDAYITFSYAKHLAQGKGFIASIGSKPSLGTTTPLFTLLLVPFAFIGVPPHLASMWIGAFCHALIAILIVLLARKFMSKWLALATECGMLSYYSERRVLDMLGLTTPEVLSWSMRRDFVGILQHYQPRFVMIVDMDVSDVGYHEIKGPNF